MLEGFVRLRSPGIFPEYPGNLPLGFRDILRDNLPDNFVINGKIVMNDLISQAHDCFLGDFRVPVPDFIGDCCSSFTNLLYIAFNGIDRLLTEDELILR